MEPTTKTGYYIEDTEIASQEPVYKVVRIEDGKFLSAFVGLSHFADRTRRWRQLDYKIGAVTESPSGSGIFCYDTVDNAKEYIQLRHITKGHPCAILKAYPVSEPPKREYAPVSPGGILCKAIIPVELVWQEERSELDYLNEAQKLLGGEIRTSTKTGLHFCHSLREYSLYHRQGLWALYQGDRGLVATKDTLPEVLDFVKQDEPRPEPKFKVGDRVKVIGGCYRDRIGNVFVLTEIFWAKDRGLTGDRYLYRGEGWNYGEDMLEHALPEPKWIDVTKECEVDLYHSSNQGSLIRLRHNNITIFEIGNEGKAWRRDDYKVETVSTSWTVNFFRVLKKEGYTVGYDPASSEQWTVPHW